MSWQDTIKKNSNNVRKLKLIAEQVQYLSNSGVGSKNQSMSDKDVSQMLKDIKENILKIVDFYQRMSWQDTVKSHCGTEKSDPMDRVTSTTSTGQDEEAAKRTKDKEKELLARILERNKKARER